MRRHRRVTEEKREFARRLRRQATPAERRAWATLRNRQVENLKFRRQHPLHGFIVDFYCADLRLILELEGAVHDDPQHLAYDRERAAILTGQGYRVVRVANGECTEVGLRRLLSYQKRLILAARRNSRTDPPTPPLPEGERGQG